MFKEINALKELSHPNIIKLLECYTLKEEMKVVLILEYLEGGNLREFLKSKKKGYLEEKEAKIIFTQILEGVNYCHRNNIIHRDLKLE